jgi:hypothetical protein
MRTFWMWGGVVVLAAGCTGETIGAFDGDAAVDGGPDSGTDVDTDSDTDTDGDAGVPDEVACGWTGGDGDHYKLCEGDAYISDHASMMQWKDCTHITGSVYVMYWDAYAADGPDVYNALVASQVVCVDGPDGVAVIGNNVDLDAVYFYNLRRANKIRVNLNQDLTILQIGDGPFAPDRPWEMLGEDTRFQVNQDPLLPYCTAVDLFNRVHADVANIDSVFIGSLAMDDCFDAAQAINAEYGEYSK